MCVCVCVCVCVCHCASKNQSHLNFKFYHMLMFNRSFLSRLVPESNKLSFLGGTRSYLKEWKVLLVLLIR